MKAKDKVIVVTGAGNGMGRQTTLELIRRGAKVFGLDIKPEALDETAKIAGANFQGLVTDISDLSSVAKVPSLVIEKFGQVDGLINVAGIIQKFIPVNDLSYEEIHKVININFYGCVHTVKEFLPHLLKRSEAQILNVSSMGGYVPVPGQTIYGASKAALKLFTEGLHSELKGTKVGVALLFPGAVNTNISLNSGVMSEKEIAQMSASSKKIKMTDQVLAGKLIVDAFERNSFRAFVGSDAKLMDRLSRLVPERAANLIQKQMAALIK